MMFKYCNSLTVFQVFQRVQEFRTGKDHKKAIKSLTSTFYTMSKRVDRHDDTVFLFQYLGGDFNSKVEIGAVS